jgi:L-threonylcarbamoyladenylate synthase
VPATVIVAATAEAVRRAALLLRAGRVVAFPTETVYGLGADATAATAVARVFEIKQRPSFDPLIVHLCDAEALGEVAAAVPAAALRLTRRFWPGPLTIVLPKRESIPDIVSAGLPSVGLRVPDHPVALELIRLAERPIAAPSANRFGFVSPTTAAHVAEQLGDLPAMILDGGPCRVGVESTVVSFLTDPPQLLRPGGVSLEELQGVIGAVDAPERIRDVRIAPGQSSRHYATRTPLVVVASIADVPSGERATAALLTLTPAAEASSFAACEVLDPGGDLHRAAANLFAAMRRLDAGGYRRIFAVAVAPHGIGRAIMDRLRRAAAGGDPHPRPD